MNDRETAELRRQFRSDRTTISTVHGCCVNEKGEIVSTFTQPLLDLTDEETDSLLTLMRKTLSGGIGKNLADISFPANDVMNTDEHKLLMTLRDTKLEDKDARRQLYDRIIPSVHTDSRYVILLAHQTYDVPAYGKDGSRMEDASESFSFIVCAVCPIKQSRAALSFAAAEKPFRNIAANSVLASPMLGFTFPAFDDRKTNIYNALFYARDTAVAYDEFVDRVFHTERPMPAGVQKQTFRTVLAEAVSDDCDMTVVEAVRDQLSDRIEIHRASHEREPLVVSKEVITDVLASCDVPQERIDTFSARYDQAFGVGAEMPPQNLVDTKHYRLETPDVSIKVNPDRTDLVTTRVIDGVKYILIRADESVALNGVDISIK